MVRNYLKYQNLKLNKKKISHPQAYYTSRLLNFNNLPEPENDSQSLSQNLLEFTIPDDVLL